MSEIVKRALTGAVYVALTLGAAFAGQWTTLLLFLPVCAIAAREWHRLVWADDPDAPNEFTSIVLCSSAYLAIALVAILPQWTVAHAGSVVLAVLSILSFLLMRRGSPQPAQELGALCATVLYVALPFGLITHLLEGGPEKFVGFMLLLWTNDTGAYLVGRAIGRTKLMPKVSPKKTVDGLLGGIALTMLVGWLLAHYWTVLSMQQWLLCSAVVAVMATIGDLLESAFKRARGVKDSGTVLPGHGGILDRFDGFLLAAPGMWLTIHLLR